LNHDPDHALEYLHAVGGVGLDILWPHTDEDAADFDALWVWGAAED
jgi:hypothetical protein